MAEYLIKYYEKHEDIQTNECLHLMSFQPRYSLNYFQWKIKGFNAIHLVFPF